MAIDTVVLEASPGELRAAALADGRTVQVEHWRAHEPSRSGAIYLGRVTRIDPGLNAAFVALGEGQDGFLRARDVDRAAEAPGRHRRIERLLHQGAAIPVQVQAEAHGDKGPPLTTQITLRGRLLDFRPGGAGVTLPEAIPEKAGERLLLMLAPLLAEHEGVRPRLALLDATERETAAGAELELLRQRWRAIDARRDRVAAPACLDPGPEPAARLMSAFGLKSLPRLIASDSLTGAALRRWRDDFAPDGVAEVEIWSGPSTPFETLGIEAAIEQALTPRIELPGGGELLFEPGETLTAIDINSRGFAGKPGSAASELNFTAIAEIARQLRLRAIAGTIVIDCVRVGAEAPRLIGALRRALADDPTRSDVHGLTSLGLLELSRKRGGPSLAERLQAARPQPSPRLDAAALAALRRALAAARARPGRTLTLSVAPQVAEAFAGPLAAAYADALAAIGRLRVVASDRLKLDGDEITADG
ncbi:MAG: S1 RNA-binding domain-containing protein [Alphaproteobacteria bacterium]|nr:S1 RNA-binding domain-containing protein [Alphaproteobacteria bacterium]